MKRRQALEGIKVADFSWVIVGPLSMKHLADHGATVVRVESHTRPETSRLSGPYKDNITSIEHSGFYPTYNSSKYGISLDLTKPRGREIALRLIMWADVVAESYTPGTMKEWGLDYESVAKLKPDIIYVSTCQYGQYGPLAQLPGYGQLAAALSGISNAIGWPDLLPSTNAIAHTDFICPHFVVATVMAALDYRRRTGRGVYLDQSQLEAAVHFFAPPVMDYLVNNRIMERSGNRLPYAAPHGAYPCRGNDRWCAIVVFSDEEWRGLCDAMGNPEWTQDPKFATFLGRKENEDELDRLVGQWTINFTAEEVMSLMQAKGVAAGVVEDLKDMFEDPQLKHYGFLRYFEHPVMGEISYQGPPFRLSKTPDGQFSAPCLGQHNEYVYKELLGLSDEEIAELLIEKVITTEADLPEFKPST